MKQSLDTVVLQEAIRNTFENRGTTYQNNHILFSETFAQDEGLNLGWNNFLKKINYERKVSFTEVMNMLTEWLEPYWEDLKSLSSARRLKDNWLLRKNTNRTG